MMMERTTNGRQKRMYHVPPSPLTTFLAYARASLIPNYDLRPKVGTTCDGACHGNTTTDCRTVIELHSFIRGRNAAQVHQSSSLPFQRDRGASVPVVVVLPFIFVLQVLRRPSFCSYRRWGGTNPCFVTFTCYWQFVRFSGGILGASAELVTLYSTEATTLHRLLNCYCYATQCWESILFLFGCLVTLYIISSKSFSPRRDTCSL